MSIRVFEELEMEFFDPKDELPASHERVMIGSPEFKYVTLVKYATVPPKFVEFEKYPLRFTINQVRCWGRLKKK